MQPLSDAVVGFQAVFFDVGSDGVAADDLAYFEELVDVVQTFEKHGFSKNLSYFWFTIDASQHPADHMSSE